MFLGYKRRLLDPVFGRDPDVEPDSFVLLEKRATANFRGCSQSCRAMKMWEGSKS